MDEEVAKGACVSDLCEALGVASSTYYRHQERKKKPPEPSKRRPPRKLSDEDEQRVEETLTCERFIDKPVPQIYNTLLDEGLYLCSQRTMYRILAKRKDSRDKRNQRRQKKYKKPELLARAPNELWSWDITKIKGPQPWIFYDLYVVLDVYSRYVVGWMLADHESGDLASLVIEQCVERQGVRPKQVTLHSDRGKSMRSKTFGECLIDLGVIQSFSRPRVANDNPYSESQFKTLKYQHTYPKRFGSMEDARLYLDEFFAWYNKVHRHSGIAYMTPEDVHTGRHKEKKARRDAVLLEAYKNHPERFVHGLPQAPSVPEEVWINKPQPIEKTA